MPSDDDIDTEKASTTTSRLRWWMACFYRVRGCGKENWVNLWFSSFGLHLHAWFRFWFEFGCPLKSDAFKVELNRSGKRWKWFCINYVSTRLFMYADGDETADERVRCSVATSGYVFVFLISTSMNRENFFHSPLPDFSFSVRNSFRLFFF